MFIFTEAGVLSALESKPLSSPQVAAACELQQRPVELLLEALVAMNVIDKLDETYKLAEVTRMLLYSDFRQLGNQYWRCLPDFLKTREDRRVHNYRDWGVPLGRRFRALKLWFVIRSYGIQGLQKLIRGHIAMAERLAAEIAETADFELLAPVPLALICFRYRPEGLDDEDQLDRLNETLVERINDSGAAYLTHTRLAGRYAIRFSIGQTTTAQRHVDTAWQRVRETARALAEASSA